MIGNVETNQGQHRTTSPCKPSQSNHLQASPTIHHIQVVPREGKQLNHQTLFTESTYIKTKTSNQTKFYHTKHLKDPHCSHAAATTSVPNAPIQHDPSMPPTTHDSSNVPSQSHASLASPHPTPCHVPDGTHSLSLTTQPSTDVGPISDGGGAPRPQVEPRPNTCIPMEHDLALSISGPTKEHHAPAFTFPPAYTVANEFLSPIHAWLESLSLTPPMTHMGERSPSPTAPLSVGSVFSD